MMEETINKIVTYFSKRTDVCKIFSGGAFDNIVYKKKNSMSDAEIFFGTYDRRADFAIKMWLNFDDIDDIDNALIDKVLRSLSKKNPELHNYIRSKTLFLDFLRGLTYESKVYAFITENIIQKNLSPNFIPMLVFGQCKLSNMKDNILRNTPPPYDPALLKFLSPLEAFPDINVSIMVTGTKKGSMISVKDFLENDVANNTLTPEDVSSIIFQIIHALLLLDYFQIMHNDFHMGNLLLQTMSAPVCLSYTVFDTTTVIKTKYIVKLYDWDRAFIKELGDNRALDERFSIKTHAIQKFIKNRDFYQFVCSMKEFPKFWNHIKNIIPLPAYNHWNYKIYKDGELEDEDLYEVKIIPSNQAKLLKQAVLEGNPDDLTDLGSWKVVNVSKEKLKIIFKDETLLKSWFGEEKYDAHNAFYFMATPAFTKIKILPGFNCQALYNPSSTLLYDLKDLFLHPGLYNNLITNIHAMCDPLRENIFIFNL